MRVFRIVRSSLPADWMSIPFEIGGDKVVFSRNDDGGGMVADLGLGTADTETVRSLRRSGPGRIRTSDQEVMSPLL